MEFIIGLVLIVLLPLGMAVFGLSLFVNAIETIKRELDK